MAVDFKEAPNRAGRLLSEYWLSSALICTGGKLWQKRY
jgi:hypothetical protein